MVNARSRTGRGLVNLIFVSRPPLLFRRNTERRPYFVFKRGGGSLLSCPEHLSRYGPRVLRHRRGRNCGPGRSARGEASPPMPLRAPQGSCHRRCPAWVHRRGCSPRHHRLPHGPPPWPTPSIQATYSSFSQTSPMSNSVISSSTKKVLESPTSFWMYRTLYQTKALLNPSLSTKGEP